MQDDKTLLADVIANVFERWQRTSKPENERPSFKLRGAGWTRASKKTKQYKAKRKVRMKMARESRRINRKK